ncbi:PAP2/haloperoxidase-like protein [Gracilaria domingensis]|nr:PAP2/haloperoxidase-like protein [Gracilaria domingensis]
MRTTSAFTLTTLWALVASVVLAQPSQNTLERQSQAYTFDLFPNVFNAITTDGLETPIQIRAFFYLNLAVFNAWSNYHPTAVDIFGRSRFKRPASEHTIENKNIAIYYCLFRLYQTSPASFGGDSGFPDFRERMIEQGLDPDDMSLDMTTPVGIGNREGMDTGRLLLMDGWNANGSLSSSDPAYSMPFADYTGYTPVNSPSRIDFPFRWQPVLESNGVGFFFRQEHVTPYAGQAIAFSQTPRQIQRRKVRSPYRHPDASIKRATRRDLRELRKYARDVLKRSAELTQRQRLLAELFDNKVFAFQNQNPFGSTSIAVAVRFFIFGPVLDLSFDEDVIYGLAANIVTFDATVAVWKEKIRHDAIRPTGQTMDLLLGDDSVEVWGGPGRDNTRIRPRDWQPLIRTMPHSEFPSGSACVCEALIEHALIFSEGRDEFPYNVTFTKGSSKFYPGRVPAENVTIPINRLSEWSRLCGESRLWAGVHFEPSVSAGQRLCKGIGRAAQDTIENLVRGKPVLKWIEWLGNDIERFWEND